MANALDDLAAFTAVREVALNNLGKTIVAVTLVNYFKEKLMLLKS